MDFVTLNVFVGCANGRVYGFTSTGAPLATASIAIGNGSATGGVVDPPLVDGVNGFVYAASGTGATPNTTHAVVVQATTALGGLRVATVGVNGLFSVHSPAFNDAYFSSPTSSSWLLYQLAYASNGAVTMYGMTFSAARVMTAGAPTAAHSFNIGTVVAEYAPTTEFINGGTDRLFLGLLKTGANFDAFPINTFPTVIPTPLTEGNGPSGMVVDNVSASAQASSIYFGTQGTNTAVKLTQATLQ